MMRFVLPLVVAALALAGCGTGSSSSSPAVVKTANSAPPSSHQIGVRTKTRGCTVHGALQDPACTPGAIFPTATAQQICKLGYSRSVRNVSSSTKRRVFLEYGITSHKPYTYEVDHLISLELGGSNSIANLWPEAAEPTPGFHEKDQVENYLHQQVCSGKITLHQAQLEIANDWLTVYHHLHG
jgi:hypothetical protein